MPPSCVAHDTGTSTRGRPSVSVRRTPTSSASGLPAGALCAAFSAATRTSPGTGSASATSSAAPARPSTLATSACRPGMSPSVHLALARPLESVVTDAGSMRPVASAVARRTVVPGTGCPRADSTRTTTGCGSAAPAGATWLPPPANATWAGVATTSMLIVSPMLSTVTVSLARPTPTPVATPRLSTRTTEVSLECQMPARPLISCPRASRGWACSGRRSPSASWAKSLVILTRASCCLTTTRARPGRPFTIAVTTAAPSPRAITAPSRPTVATSVLLLLHAMGIPTSTPPVESVALTAKWSVSPTADALPAAGSRPTQVGTGPLAP